MEGLLKNFKFKDCKVKYKPNSHAFYENVTLFPLDFYIIHNHDKGYVTVHGQWDKEVAKIRSHNYSDKWLTDFIMGTKDYITYIKEVNLKKLTSKI